MGHRSSLTLETEDMILLRSEIMPCRPTEVIHHDCDDVRPGAGLGAHQAPDGQQGDEEQPRHHILSLSVSLLSPVSTAPLPDLTWPTGARR